MALTTYADLKTSVGTWLNRADLASYIPDFIRLGEQRIFYGGDEPHLTEPLRVPAMMTRATGTITSSAIAFPTRFLEPVRVVASSGGSDWSLDYIAPQMFSEHSNSSATPSVYTYLNNQIETSGSGAASYTLDYYQALASLTNDTDTNWVLTNAPGVYLYASLIESAPFLMDTTMFSAWLSNFKALIGSLNRTTRRQGGGSLAVRVMR